MGMAKRKPWTAKSEAAGRALRLDGYTHAEIATRLGYSKNSVQLKSQQQGWLKGKKPLEKPQRELENRKSMEEARELVRSMVLEDIENTLAALKNHSPEAIDELPQLLTRERIAESVQKRAGTLLGFDESDKNVVNIAILSQLPDDPSDSASTTYDAEL